MCRGTISERLHAIIERTTGGNVNEFVRRCRRMDPDAAPTYSAVRKYLAGGIPGINKAAVMAAVGNVSLQWLARGTEAPKAPIVPEDDDRVLIPLAGFSAGAENGSGVFAAEIADYVSYNREYIRRLGVAPARLVVITVAGDSMAPTLSPGDQLLIARRDGEPIIDRAVYVLYGRYGGVAVKRLYWRPNGALHIIGDAQEEPLGVIDMRGEEGEWRVVGRVLRVEKPL